MTRRTTLMLLLVLGSLPGCQTYRHTRQASEAVSLQNWDAAVYHYLEATALDPTNPRLRMELQRARMRAGEEHFRLGHALPRRRATCAAPSRSSRSPSSSTRPTSTPRWSSPRRARSWRSSSQPGGQTKLEAMKKAASEMKVKPPMLDPKSKEPMSLSFPNPTNVKDIYHALGQAFGINVLYDPRLKDNKITIDLARRHGASGARDGDAGVRPLLQGARRGQRDHRRGHAAEPPRLRGPRGQDVLPLQRRRQGRQQLDPGAHRRAPAVGQRAAQLAGDPRHRRQGGDRRAADRRQRQVARRGADRRRAHPGRRQQAARHRHVAVQQLRTRSRSTPRRSPARPRTGCRSTSSATSPARCGG